MGWSLDIDACTGTADDGTLPGSVTDVLTCDASASAQIVQYSALTATGDRCRCASSTTVTAEYRYKIQTNAAMSVPTRS